MAGACCRILTGSSRVETHTTELPEVPVLLILAVILLAISIAGGVIIHPILFALAIVAIAMFFSGRRGRVVP